MSDFLKHIIRFFLFILIQHFLLNQIPPLHHTAVPILYYLFILWLPFRIGRSALLLVCFALGISMDFFTKTPGMHAFASVFIGYLRPYLIGFLMPQEGLDFNFKEPSVQSMGIIPYISFAFILTVVHHFCLFSIQAFQFGDIVYLIVKTSVSVLISLVLILTVELVFHRKQKFLTNT